MMRKQLALAIALTFILTGFSGTALISKGMAMAADSLKDTTQAVPDTTKKVTPAPPPQATPAAMDTTKSSPATGQPVDTTKKITPPPTPAATTAKPDTTKAGAKPAATTTKHDSSKAGAKPAMTTTKPDTSKAKAKSAAPAKPTTEAVDPKAPYKSISFAKGEKPKIVMETTMGKMVIELWPDVAPKHCQSFVYLVNKKFYDSLIFHRVMPGFVIQGGDPLGNGTGGPGYTVPAEFSNKPHEDGILSMARAPDVNSAGSQFFICLGRLASLDNKYTVFGKVIEGLDVAHKIEKVKTQAERPVEPVYMTKVYVEKGN